MVSFRLLFAPGPNGRARPIIADEHFNILIRLIQSRYDSLFQKFQPFKRGYGNCYESFDNKLAPAMSVALRQAAADTELFG